MNTVAIGIGQNLDFDMSWLANKLFDKYPVIGKAGSRFAGSPRKTLTALRFIVSDAHTFATATGAGLEHYRIPDSPRPRNGLVRIGQYAIVPGDGRNPGRIRQSLGRDLVTHHLNGINRRSNECDAGCFDRCDKSAIFRQKTVTGVNRICPGMPTGLKDVIDHQITLGRRSFADMHRLVCHQGM